MTSLCDASMTLSVDVMYHVTGLDTQFAIVALSLEPMSMWHARSSHPEQVRTMHMCTKQSKYEKICYLAKTRCYSRSDRYIRIRPVTHMFTSRHIKGDSLQSLQDRNGRDVIMASNSPTVLLNFQQKPTHPDFKVKKSPSFSFNHFHENLFLALIKETFCKITSVEE